MGWLIFCNFGKPLNFLHISRIIVRRDFHSVSSCLPLWYQTMYQHCRSYYYPSIIPNWILLNLHHNITSALISVRFSLSIFLKLSFLFLSTKGFGSHESTPGPGPSPSPSPSPKCQFLSTEFDWLENTSSIEVLIYSNSIGRSARGQ